MIRNIGLALVSIAILWLGGRAIYRALASDETKIRWKIEDARQGFENTRMDPILDLFARDYRDESLGFSRDDLRAGLASVFFQEKDPATKGFPFRAEIPAEDLSIEIGADGAQTARVKMRVRIRDVRKGDNGMAWEFRVDAQLANGDDGWRITHTTNDTIRGSSRLK